MAAFLANVGANAGHRARSPLYPDSTFELHPIPETGPWAPPMRRLPQVWGDRPVHIDPDLKGDPPTYGDNCRRAGRAFSLRQARPGDVIVFIARLHPTAEAGQPGFHLVGELRVAEIRADLTADPGPGWWDANAHVLRARAGASWDSFWIFLGGAGTRLFERAVPFRRHETSLVFDESWAWPEHRSELQVIASHTRAIRRLTGRAERALLRMCS